MKKLIVILLLLVVAIPLAACQSSAGNISSAPNSSALAESTIESSKVSSSKISTASSMTEVLGIKGSHYTDVKLSLENRGFDVVHPKYNSDSNCKIYNNNYIDLDSGIRYGCDMTINNNFEIVNVSFSSENINGVNNSTFIDASDNYLEFCSTMPYDVSDTKIIKRWVGENISKVQNKPTKQIGDALFQLVGTPNAIILNVEKAEENKSTDGTSSKVLGPSDETFQYINKP